jgi:phosphatidylglycerophosphate synthase
VPALRTGPALGLLAQLTLLEVLARTVGLTGLGGFVGVVYGLTVAAALTWGMDRAGTVSLGRADEVTLLRAVLGGGVAALCCTPHPALAVLIPLASIALALDLVDGAIARRTNTVTALGARFDVEVDAFLLLTLSVYVAGGFGPWVLAIGVLRYAWVAAAPLLPWLRGHLAPRRWRKIAAAAQGVVLVAAASALLPRPLVLTALALSLATLLASFASCVHILWHARPEVATTAPDEPAEHILERAA